MQNLLKAAPQIFPLFFLALWLGVTTLLGFLSGWFFNMIEFPDQPEPALLILGRQSAMMGLGVSMSRVLSIEVCSGGIRIKILRIFGPFCRDFFVPWRSLQVTRKNSFFFPAVILSFGKFGRIRINSWIGDQIAASAKEHWPEKNLPPPMALGKLKQQYLLRWVLMTSLGASFFTFVPMLVPSHQSQRPPILVAIFFPAFVFGAVTILSYLSDAKGFKK